MPGFASTVNSILPTFPISRCHKKKKKKKRGRYYYYPTFQTWKLRPSVLPNIGKQLRGEDRDGLDPGSALITTTLRYLNWFPERIKEGKNT